MAFGAYRGAGDLAEFCVAQRVIRSAELRSVGEIEALRPELELPALGEREVLEDGEIEVRAREARSSSADQDCLPSAIAGEKKFAVLNHSLGLRPLAGAAFGSAPFTSSGEQSAPDTLASVCPNRERLTGVEGKNAVQMPIAKQSRLQHAIQICAVLLAAAEGNVVIEAGDKVMADIPGSTGV